jgi:hypothetical protein
MKRRSERKHGTAQTDLHVVSMRRLRIRVSDV